MGTWSALVRIKLHTYCPQITYHKSYLIQGLTEIQLYTEFITCGRDVWLRLASTSLIPAFCKSLPASVAFIQCNIQHSSGIMKGKWAGMGIIIYFP